MLRSCAKRSRRRCWSLASRAASLAVEPSRSSSDSRRGTDCSEMWSYFEHCLTFRKPTGDWWRQQGQVPFEDVQGEMADLYRQCPDGPLSPSPGQPPPAGSWPPRSASIVSRRTPDAAASRRSSSGRGPRAQRGHQGNGSLRSPAAAGPAPHRPPTSAPAVGGDSVGRSSIDTAQRSRRSTLPPRGGSTMPRNESLRRDLLEMASLDRVTRAELAASGDLFDTGYEPRMARVHARNAQRLRRVIESVGWPGTDLVGPDGAEAAWLILQHAIAEPDLLRSASPLLETAAREGRADPAHAAMLEDRIRFFEGRPQRYGTQLDWDAEGNLSPGECGGPASAGRAPTRRGPPPAGGTDREGAQPGDGRGRAAAGSSSGVRESAGRMGGKCRLARRLSPLSAHTRSNHRRHPLEDVVYPDAWPQRSHCSTRPRTCRAWSRGRRSSDAAHSSASNSRRKAASARRNPVSVNVTDFALLTGSEISPFR